jgi:hypothetical protein
MNRLAVSAVGAIAIAVLNTATARAQALSTTTFVSGNGLDSNPCTHTAPCRSFAAAVAATSPGGQVTMLDAAGYGKVTITKSLSIVNDGGGEAGIADPGAGQNAITITIAASDVVNLRGLTLNGVGTGSVGIDFESNGTLNIQNCEIRGFVSSGVLVIPVASSALTISDTIVSNNNGTGVLIAPVNGTVTAQLERVAAIDNAGGFQLKPTGTGQIQATIVDSAAMGNGPNTGGVGFYSDPGLGAFVALINSKAIHNGIGVETGQVSSATYISQVTLAGNVTNGFLIDVTGALLTFGDNYIIDTNNTGTLIPVGAQ